MGGGNVMQAKRRLITQTIVNCRDLGGYPCKGGVTQYGRVLRCGVPGVPTQADFDLLREYGIKSVIDLRGDGEAHEMPSAFPEAGFDYHRASLFEANPAAMGKVNDMSDLYLYCMREYRENIRAVLSLIASFNHPFLVHCFLGKDRTGILCASLLAAAGVAREDIIADYVLSEVYLKPFYNYNFEHNTGLLWEADATRLASSAKSIERVLDTVDAEFGGFGGYFTAIGLTEQEQQNVGNILV